MMKIARKAKPTSPISSIVIQIAVMRIWHELDPAWAFNNASRVGSYEPKGLVSPSQERTTSDLINREIPNKRTTREGLKAIIMINTTIISGCGIGPGARSRSCSSRSPTRARFVTQPGGNLTGWTDGFAEGSMRPPPRRIVGSSWWDRACCARSPFRKETYHVSITDADDRRHDFVGVGGWYPSHLHRRGA